ncbi:hydantoinase/oxoprolinase family protein [Salibacterium aidingense]|uniref:hydantoinase/oxoprolinase family protein n=1 Tax=Salibacterium aidingense TaxID=384933 RepID=UPI00042A646E|nr:hydantoinase/oxoprolinase family protein [Salibacterium aidingense]
MSRYRIAADIGGTFTDVVLYDKQTGKYQTAKSPSTPEDLSLGVLNGVNKLISNLKDVDFFVHGTTAGLNAFLERKGADMSLILTKGFKDIYEIGRANRPEIYNIQYRQPKRLIERRDVFEVNERMLADGSVDTPLNEEEVLKIIDTITERGLNSVSICLLHAYNNPEHEKQIRHWINEYLPHVSVSLSHEIVREWREYERTSTTIINAYIAPIVERYLKKLDDETKKKDLDSELYIMQSNGGVMTAEIAKKIPIQTMMSGPVGGTIGGTEIGQTNKLQHLICVDMGGTSFDVSMIVNGQPDVTSEAKLEKFPIMTPMVNIHTIGAGGGSIAWVEGGGLRVGPESAGSNPGPACYGNNGKEATVTDANLVLGRIDSEGFSSSDMQLDYRSAYNVIEKVAEKLDLSVVETAEGICDIANAKMADAIRTLTISKGIDPRDFALVAFGGAGPMHAMFIAEKLGINKIMIPSMAGTFSAWGMLQTDIRHDDVRTYVSTMEECDNGIMNRLYHEMKTDTDKILNQQKISEKDRVFTYLSDLRYAGQEYTVTVPLSSNEVTNQNLKHLITDFHEKHLNIYGHNNPEGQVEIVNLRLTGKGLLKKEQRSKGIDNKNGRASSPRSKPVIWKSVEKETTIYSIFDLTPNKSALGPMIIETSSSTVVVPEDFNVVLDSSGSLEITRRNHT